MKIIFNQNCIEEEDLFVNYTKKNYFSGDFVAGFCWFFQNKFLFWEDVYFQLMASLRKMRIKIPLSYTPEMFESQLRLLSDEMHISEGRIKITVFRDPEQDTSFIIEFLPHQNFLSDTENEIDIYKEILIYPNLLSSISVFHPIDTVALQYVRENDLQEVILLNHEKRIARSISGNIFLIQDNNIYSNPASEGALISVLKKNFISFLREKTDFIYREENISPFLTQSADELFILSDEKGILPVTKNRKTIFKKNIIPSLTKKFIGYALDRNKSIQ
ncbi:MAG: aminotransferase class IV [Flavobacteriaceae bacterium]|jgi:branched-chain amino acid aminotransferase|nr:aminotransferase class IV [Flavobacteriaceae bacterium]